MQMQEFRKSDYTIFARNAYPGEYVYNELEGSEYTTDENKSIILCGTVGEMWVVSFDKLASTYTYADGAPISEADTLGWRLVPSDDEWWEVRPIQDYNAPTIFAYQTSPNEQTVVETSWGEVLTANRPGIPHGDGDWIVFANDGSGNPNIDDAWIVNGEVFENTYEEVS